MKKFNITSNDIKTITLTCIIWVCVIIAAAFALQNPTNVYVDAFGTIGYLIIAGLVEWLKYKITHNNE